MNGRASVVAFFVSSLLCFVVVFRFVVFRFVSVAVSLFRVFAFWAFVCVIDFATPVSVFVYTFWVERRQLLPPLRSRHAAVTKPDPTLVLIYVFSPGSSVLVLSLCPDNLLLMAQWCVSKSFHEGKR